MTLKQELLQFLQQKSSSQIDESDPLIDRGLIDSMGCMEIIHLVEERTGVLIPDEEVTHENFQTLASIDRMVQRLSSGRAAPGASIS